MRSGGLKVYTTIVPRYNDWRSKPFEGVERAARIQRLPIDLVEPADRAIRAMAAVIPGRRNNQFNLLSQARRQPGSTFKTFVLTAAVHMGIDPMTNYYVSAPFTYRPVRDGNSTTARGGA